MQDFYAIAVVPRTAEGFCIKANLRRVFVWEPALPTPDFNLKDFSAAADLRIRDYLFRRYPRGTPVDELDVEVGDEQMTEAGKAVPALGKPFAPSVNNWFVGNWRTVPVIVESATTGGDGRQSVSRLMAYKTRAEVWLQMLRDEYETELVRSPLERGLVLFSDLPLFACQSFPKPDQPGTRRFDDDSTSTGSLTPSFFDFNPNLPSMTAPQNFSNIAPYRAAVMSWNSLGQQLQRQPVGLGPEKESELRFDNPRLLDLLLTNAANLLPGDPGNQSLDQVATLFSLTPDQVNDLKANGVNDLRALASWIKFAPQIERQNRELEESLDSTSRPSSSRGGCNFLYRAWLWLLGRRPVHDVEAARPRSATMPITAGRSEQLRATLGANLQAHFEEATKQKP